MNWNFLFELPVGEDNFIEGIPQHFTAHLKILSFKRIRNSAQSRCLQENGQMIRVFTLQGRIFP